MDNRSLYGVKKNANVLIVGYGVVGQNMHKIFKDAIIYDPFLKTYCSSEVLKINFDIAFVCVPTEKLPDGDVDVSVVRQAVKEHQHHVETFCIKSTIPPGETKKLRKIYDKVVFSPEYFGGTQHANAHEYDFVILGGEKRFSNAIADQYEKRYPGSLKIYFTDSKTAEIVKYAENAWIAMKVTFCNEFKRICDLFGVNYKEFRELWLADPRINRSHTFVYPDSPYYDSHCLNKDIPGIIVACKKNRYIPEFLIAMERYNEDHKK